MELYVDVGNLRLVAPVRQYRAVSRMCRPQAQRTVSSPRRRSEARYYVLRNRNRSGWMVYDPNGVPIRFKYSKRDAIDFANVLNALNALPLIERPHPKS